MSVEFKDYYKILGVDRTADAKEIKAAFRKLARKYHPDVAKDLAGAEDKFKEINEANEVLSDPGKRRHYDELGRNWDQPEGQSHEGPGRRRGRAAGSPEFYFTGTGFSDFFSEFFGGVNPFGGASAPRHARRQSTAGSAGRNIEADIMVTLNEVIKGVVREVSLRRVDPRTGGQKTQKLRVKIPAGVPDGKQIRIAAKGEDGVDGAPAGNLYLRIVYAQHPEFSVRGSDLHCDLELMPWDTVLGGRVTVDTLEGKASLKIPAGTVSGQQFRLRGKGLPDGKTGDRGDLFVHTIIQTPAKVTSEQRKLWEKLAALHGKK